MSGNGYGMRFLVRNNCFSTRTNFSDVSMNKTSCLKILLINTAANALTHTTLYYYLRARIVYALLRLQTWTLSFRVFQPDFALIISATPYTYQQGLTWISGANYKEEASNPAPAPPA